MKSQERVTHYVVQARMSGEFDTDILHRKCFDVNMRLFECCSEYKSFVMDIIKYMGKLSKCDFLDYSKLQGISGANLGIPFNIVGVRATAKAIKDGLSAIEGTLFFLINPKVVEESKETYIVMSNCGSIRLPKKIKVERHEWVKVGYYDLTGAPKEDVFKGAFGSTLQHEIEHNLGILITDKEETGNDEEKSN